MRRRRHTAKGFFSFSLVSLLFLVFSAEVRAQVSVCLNSAVVAGDSNVACEGMWDVKLPEDVSADDMVLVCRGASHLLYGLEDDCSANGGEWRVFPPSYLGAADMLYQAYGPPYMVPLVRFVVPVGVSGGGGGEWTLEDLDLSKAAGAFAAAFMVCWMFWGLGKGVGLLVGFLRRV